jgi:hypothetical protein
MDQSFDAHVEKGDPFHTTVCHVDRWQRNILVTSDKIALHPIPSIFVKVAPLNMPRGATYTQYLKS